MVNSGMHILLSNDDGIFAEGLWALARQLSGLGRVSVAAPDREQSATGTMVTLRTPLRVMEHNCFHPGISTYSIEGSPSDSVILALGKLVPDAALVVSGINQGLNLGDDVLISGTVGAALQGYLRGLSAIAISVPPESSPEVFDLAARFGAQVAGSVLSGKLGSNVFLNINLPNRQMDEISGVRVSDLAHKTHIDSVREGNDGRRQYYWLIREQLSRDVSPSTDIWAVEHGFISITPLHSCLFRRPDGEISEEQCSAIFDAFKTA
ncbi:MAG: 5'/3'-nucleotidase SurE [Dehalococcoidaceae bacterium]|nr:5'/3'-nucleotidase SurE [Dehalococcoidaceae bacterium]